MQMHERRREVLKFFYERQHTGAHYNPYGDTPVEEWAEIAGICRYLREKGYITWNVSNRPDRCECGRITADGVDHYEGTDNIPTVSYQFGIAHNIQIGNDNTISGNSILRLIKKDI